MDEQQNLLEIKDLRVSFPVDGEIIRAVNGISLTLGKGESLGVVASPAAEKRGRFQASCGSSNRRRRYRGEVILDGLDIMRLSESR
jgi:ABC-type glutathione transport system ATPase component